MIAWLRMLVGSGLALAAVLTALGWLVIGCRLSTF